MATTMNNLLIQTGAVSIFALVALFPTKDDLKEAIGIAAPASYEITDEPEALVIDAPYFDNEILSVRSPFPLACAGAEGRVGIADLTRCTNQLDQFIRVNETHEAAFYMANGTGFTEPKVEQARRALIEICRYHWSKGNAALDPEVRDVCQRFY